MLTSPFAMEALLALLIRPRPPASNRLQSNPVTAMRFGRLGVQDGATAIESRRGDQMDDRAKHVTSTAYDEMETADGVDDEAKGHSM